MNVAIQGESSAMSGQIRTPSFEQSAGRNINNLRYADDTTRMAESEEELKSLLMKVKEESDNPSLLSGVLGTGLPGLAQYASKFGKLCSGHRTGKGQFSFQSQRKAIPKMQTFPLR